ncbi:MAG TPA: hypothetical protein VK148_16375, partial [Xanthobacteraceae bacterium]|nr:hypothetical protein [Xanthobacteraceae bacterium]
MISGPAGWDDQRPRQRQCVTMHGDWSFRPPKHDAGMPVSAADCPELRSFKRDGAAHQRWRISTGTDALPTYVEPQDYFSGANGLPITGPMGRCLTADFPQRIAVTSDCDGRVEQNWRVNGELIQLGPQGDCLARDEGGGAVRLTTCTNAANQKWSYVVLDPIPNPRWLNAAVYGQIRPSDASGQCLIVANDPFTDPVRQRNPVKVAACSAVLPRQTSWFRPTSVRTIRIALLRFSDDDGGKPALGNLSDAEAKRIMEGVAFRLSEHYRTMGVRFVFLPEHDYMRVNDTVANQKTRSVEGAIQITKVAAGALYGKATLVVTAGMGGGGFSGADPAEFEPSRLIHWINRTPINGNYPGLPKDRAGLPGVAYYVAETGINASSAGAPHHAHEFGHYFGLAHVFGPDEFADTPDDTIDGNVWLRLGTITCGNPRTSIANGKPITPDRLNNEGYWGCLLGRTNNSFSPLQLGKATWVLNNQLNRYPLVACQPTDGYDANKVECENAESLALRQQSAAYLKDKIGIVVACQLGGTYARAIAAALEHPAVLHLLQKTPAGQSFISKLAGGRPAAATFGAVSDALRACQNLPLTMALMTRMGEFRELANQRHPSLAKNGFAVKGAPLAVADQQAVTALSAQVLTPAFIANVPS